MQGPYKGDGYLMGYTYDKKSKGYLRSMPWGPHVLADGKRVSTDNVLVIKARQHYEHHEPFHDVIDTKGYVPLLQPGPVRGPGPGARPGSRSRSASR